MIVLIAFCSQGDNIQDALSLATYIDQWLELKPQKVCKPGIVLINSTRHLSNVVVQ